MKKIFTIQVDGRVVAAYEVRKDATGWVDAFGQINDRKRAKITSTYLRTKKFMESGIYKMKLTPSSKTLPKQKP